MKAWRLTMSGPSLELQDVPDPSPRAGLVLLRVHASALVSYLREYVEGSLLGYNPPADPFTPGTNGLGIIEAVGEDVFGLHAGQRVLATGYVVAAENVADPAQALLSMTALPSLAPAEEAFR
ncbi:MAG TPA: alcohol dehydrogenase catalytic domain-containing protein [Pseudonocardiaceae bacterium]|jgi:alcohol dehydrogenase|nr:alcohol dehydrogenase catalytic domain-containing protein [Pseudonocardiaceae bacterium]